MSISASLPLKVVSGYLTIVFKAQGANLLKKLEEGPKKVQQAAWIAVSSMAPEVENYAKMNAPWTDRTGNARNGLAARPFRDAQAVGVMIYHQVSYGIWLEVRWSGRYAIINPTIDEMGPVVMKRFNRILERL